VAVHPRLSVNSICSYGQSLADDLVLWRELGVDQVALILPKLEEAGWADAEKLVTDAGLRVSTIFGPTYRPLDADPALGWREEDQAGTDQTLEFAAKVGAGSVYICTGAATTLSWDDAAAAFCEFLAPSVALANSLGVPLLLEPTNPMRIDVSFVFWQRDAMDLARQAGTEVMLDFQSCWYERDLHAVVRDNIDLIHMVQLSDFVIGTNQTGDRAVPGDGDIPLESLVEMVLEAGFEGAFDLELMGPRIDAEGYASVIRRAVDWSSNLLERLGA
jgi:sugar phosphate isomerase/epimerase